VTTLFFRRPAWDENAVPLKPTHPPAVLPLREAQPAAAPADPPDALLCQRARAGEEDAFRMLFERHAPAVRRFAGNLVRDPFDATEVTQETFVRAHARLGRLKDDTRFRSWVLGIARIVALDLIGERRRYEERPAETAQVVELDATPEAALLDGEAEKVLFSELERLSAERRAVLLLRLDQELGYADIAETMGWTLQKVKNEIHRARRQMRDGILRYLRGAR
jgi:RNA polymerase sigma-70 factor (ECF subfamily)